MRKRVVICILTIAMLINGCASEQNVNLSSTPIARTSFGKDAVQGTHELMDVVLEPSVKTLPGEFSGIGSDCWDFLKQTSAIDPEYSLLLVADTADTPYPFRDVQDVHILIRFSKGQEAYIIWYAGVVTFCNYGNTLLNLPEDVN
jgi:hypothetical protein